MPLSPSFPDWLLKRDPTLAGALTNPIFLAFEERRGRRPRAAALVDSQGLMIPLLLVLGVAFMATVVLVNPSATGSWAWLGVVMIVVLAPTFAQLRRRWRRNGRGSGLSILPLEVTRAIKPGLADGLAADLALLPFTTAMTFHASLLERRRQDAIKSALVSVASVGIVSCIVAHGVVSVGRQFSSIDFATLGALFLLIPHFGILIYWALARISIELCWEALDAIRPLGVEIHPRPVFASPSGLFVPFLIFAPTISPLIVDVIGEGTETQRVVFFLVIALFALGCHLLAGWWRRGLIENIESMRQIHPKNLADILLDTESMITRGRD